MPCEPGQLLFGFECVGLQELGSISEELREYLLQEEVFCASEERLPGLGFQRVDHAKRPGHTCYEDYFHGLPTHEGLKCMFPRSGSDFSRPAAPLRLRAFCEAARRVNQESLQLLAAEAPSGSLVRRLVEGGFSFGDVCCQIHAGAPVTAERVAWHVDRPNSLLHMALGLQAPRTVHALLRPAAASERDAALRAVEKAQARTLETRFERARTQIAELVPDAPARLPDGDAEPPAWTSLARSPGDAYICNAISYVHGVEYPSVEWEDRVIAVQLRLFIGMDEDFEPSMEWGSDRVASAIATLPWRLPSLEEVRTMASELEALQGRQKAGRQTETDMPCNSLAPGLYTA